MKKESSVENPEDNMRPEYDFGGGVRGAAFRPLDQGYNIREEHPDGTVTVREAPPRDEIQLDADVREFFPDSAAVNHALRTLIALFPKLERKTKNATRKPHTAGGSEYRTAARQAKGK